MTITAQIRQILRETGAARPYGMWTNLYKNCRTVKCIAPKNDELIIDAALEIEQLCESINIPFSMKVKTYYTSRSVIVRVPLTA